MCESDLDWKEENIRAVKESLVFFSNKQKLNREKCVVKQLLNALLIDFEEEEMAEADEPADVSFRDAKFQVKEIMDEGRRRTDEFKTALDKAEKAKNYRDLQEQSTLIDIPFSDAVKYCHTYAMELISLSKYGTRELKDIDLLCYFNLQDYHEAPPNDVQYEALGFLSLSVVGNRYCEVVYAATGAPQFLKDNIGKIVKYFDV